MRLSMGARRKPRLTALLFVPIFLFFGFLISAYAFSALSEWSSIGAGYAACAISWTVAGPIMFVCGIWLLGSLGRNSSSLRVAGSFTAFAGAVMFADALIGAIPCSGPE